MSRTYEQLEPVISALDERIKTGLSAFPTDTAEGSIASFADGADGIPLKSLVVNIDPVQSGSGDPSPTNVRPISGWTGMTVSRTGINQWDEEWEVGGIRTADGTNVDNSASIRSKDFNLIIGGASYYIKSVTKATRTVYIFFYDENKDYIGYNDKIASAVTAPSNARFFKIQPTSAYGLTYNHDISINYPSTDHDYHPGTVASVEVQLGQTVYGGKLDVLSGVLTVYPYYASYNGETLTGRWISDRDVYAVGATPTIGAQVVNIGAEGTEIQLSPHEVKSLLGQNNIFADTGDAEVEYRADTKMYIERLTEPDADMIADSNIVSGQYFMVGNNLYLATANIASGASVIVGTNCTQKSLATALNEINS